MCIKVMRKNIIDKCRKYHITSLYHITRSSYHQISHHITSQAKKNHNNSNIYLIFQWLQFLFYNRYFNSVKCSELCKTVCICKSFLPIHKYKHIGEIYYHFPLRLLHKFRYALSKNRDCSISQILLVRWRSNFHTIILRFFSTDIIGFESIRAIFMPKNQRFLQGLQKKHFQYSFRYVFFNLKYLENYWSD